MQRSQELTGDLFAIKTNHSKKESLNPEGLVAQVH